MISEIDDAAAAFRAVNPVSAPAFEDAARDPQAAQTLTRITATRPGWAARHRWLRPAIVAAPLTGIAAAVIALVLVTTGGTTTRIATASYTVTKTPDGTVSVVLNDMRAVTDPRGLSRTLASEGVPNRVLISRPSCPPGSTSYGPKPLPSARYVFSAGPGASVIVHPNKMPPGSVVVIAVTMGPDGPYSIMGSLTFHPPTCALDIRAR
jgi:hypothetical protein